LRLETTKSYLKKFDELISKHAGSVKLNKDFKELRKEFNERMEKEALS